MTEAPPPQEYPLLVFSRRDELTLYDVINLQRVVLHVPWLHNVVCVATAGNWLLLQDLSSTRLSLLDPFSMKTLQLPQLKAAALYKFCITLPPGDPNCYIVGIHSSRPLFVYCRPGAKKWKHSELKPEFGIVCSAVSCNGKVYGLSLNDALLVIDLVPHPVVEYLQVKPPSCMDYGYCTHVWLVESCGEIFLVEPYFARGLGDSPCRFVQVSKMDFSTSAWVSVDNIKGRVFSVGCDYSMSFSAAKAGVRGNFIYFTQDGALYSFNLEYRSLTFDYLFLRTDASFEPFWFWPYQRSSEPVTNSSQEDEEDNGGTVLPISEQKAYFDNTNFLLTHPVRAQNLGQRVLSPVWSPKTPWLMFTHGYDGTYKCLDPCSKKPYLLHFPELAGKDIDIRSSKGGWLTVMAGRSSIFLFNPFSRKSIPLLPLKACRGFLGITFSSSPPCADCVLFCILSFSEKDVIIYTYHFGDKVWTRRVHKNDILFELTNSNPVFHEGLFYCLGLNGDVGVYDLRENTWRIIRCFLDELEYPVGRCSLVDSDGELLSVFVDDFDTPLEVFRYDFLTCSWDKVSDLGHRTLYVDEMTSFCAPAIEERMANKICMPFFKEEYSYELVVHPVFHEGGIPAPCKKTEYKHIWIEPKGVLFGLDCAKGKVHAFQDQPSEMNSS